MSGTERDKQKERKIDRCIDKVRETVEWRDRDSEK